MCLQKTIRYALIILLIEKIIQHSIVTAAFYLEFGDFRDMVAVPYELLMLSGVIIGILFGLGLWALLKNQPWTSKLICFLALLDIVGEFVAQGTLIISFTLSFFVALALLILALHYSSAY